MTEDSQRMATSTDVNQMLELSDQNFRAVIIKTIQQSIIKSLETNGKIESFSKDIKLIILKITNGNYRTQKYSITNESLSGWDQE